MKLDRLHIQGFKSFKERTTIHFDQGITGIVGPNGCGKSNIVDALFWVMGAQSAKHLRGKSMKDLIFSGSEKYAPANWAEVTLVLNNDEGKHIHIGSQVVKPTEIQLTRKLYRNGETEYRINSEPARLKDIQEVFMDTGAGAKSYAIIAQGEINRLVQSKPEERRTMIEEVAGITKFKVRRKESMRKLESTEQNLNRLQDLQTEIHKNLKSLEKQAEKANRARSLKEKIKRHELISESHKELEYINQYLENSERLETKTNLISEFAEKKTSLEENLAEERDIKGEQSLQIETAQEEYNEKAKELAKNEQRLEFIQKNIEDQNKQYERKAHENGEILNDIEERSAKLVELKEEFENFNNLELSEERLEELTELTENLKSEIEELNASFSEQRNSLDELKTQKNQFYQEKEANASKLEECSRQLEDISIEIEELEKESSVFSDKLVQDRQKKEALEERYNNKTHELKEIEQAYTEAKENFETLEVRYNELKQDITYKSATLKSLNDINAQFDQAFQGTEDLIASDQEGFELVGNLIESSEEYSKVIETISRRLLKTILTETNNDQENILNWIANQSSSGIELAIPNIENPDDAETIERLSLKGFGEALRIRDLISVREDKYKEQILSLFNGFYIVENINLLKAKELNTSFNFKAIIDKSSNTLVINNGNSILIHALNQNVEAEGMVSRNNKITELENDLNNLETEFNELENNYLEAKELQATLKNQNETIYNEFIDIKTEFTGLKSSLEAKESVKDSGSSKLAQLSKRKDELSIRRLDLIEVDEKLNNQFDSFDNNLEEIQNSLNDVESELTEKRSQYDTYRSELAELQALAKTFDSQKQSFENQITDTSNQIERYQEKLEQNRDFQTSFKEQIEEMNLELEELGQSLVTEKEDLAQKKLALNEMKDTFAELLSSMQLREDEVRDITQKVNKLEKDCVEHAGKIEKAIENEEIIARNIFETYQIDLRECLSEFLEISDNNMFSGLIDLSAMYVMETEEGTEAILKNSYTFVKKFPGEVRESRDKYKRYRGELKRLGEINWQAVEDYDRQKLRYDFLRSQEIELKQSLTDLETAIEHIDQKSRERFKMAFNEVNERFVKVFPIIFGGGNARLEVVGHIDTPECGIDIIAQPPGKKMQSINLMSGGEKAMTAVSLIFSIFLVKPSPFCLLDEVDAPLDDANVGRFNELLREMSSESQFILITHNKKTMELNDTLYGVTMQEPGVSSAVSVQLH